MSSAKRCTCDNVIGKVIDVDMEKNRAKHRALGDSGCDWDSQIPQQRPSADGY